jgi:hypothetical protein
MSTGLGRRRKVKSEGKTPARGVYKQANRNV